MLSIRIAIHRFEAHFEAVIESENLSQAKLWNDNNNMCWGERQLNDINIAQKQFTLENADSKEFFIISTAIIMIMEFNFLRLAYMNFIFILLLQNIIYQSCTTHTHTHTIHFQWMQMQYAIDNVTTTKERDSQKLLIIFDSTSNTKLFSNCFYK